MLTDIVQNFLGRRIAVIGDLMLDVYRWGRADRISPEAPVPVLRVIRTTHCLGGAANVMRNITSLGGRVEPFGLIGDDAAGDTVCRCLQEAGIRSSSLIRSAGRRTTVKERLIAGTQQLMRLDFEETAPIERNVRERLLKKITKLLESGKVEAVIFEDYGKGLLSTELVQAVNDVSRAAGIPTMLDPKPGHLGCVTHLSVIKPNRAEAFAMAGMQDEPDAPAERRDELLCQAARIIRKQWQPDTLIISLAGDGMAIFGKFGRQVRIPTRAQEVFDVSGAGDTLTAAFTLAMISGASIRNAAEIANAASGIVVGKVGTVAVEKKELLTSLKGMK